MTKTEKKIQKIIDHRLKGNSVETIAVALRIAENTVKKYLRQNNLLTSPYSLSQQIGPPVLNYPSQVHNQWGQQQSTAEIDDLMQRGARLTKELEKANEQVNKANEQVQELIQQVYQKDQQFQEVKKTLATTLQELNQVKKLNGENLEVIRKQDQQMHDEKQQHYNNLLAIQIDYGKVKETFNKEKAASQEKIETLTKQIERQKKHSETLELNSLHEGSDNTLKKFDWWPVATVGLLIGGAILLPIWLNHVKKTTTQNQPQKPIMYNKIISGETIKSNPSLPPKTNLDKRLKFAIPYPPLKVIVNNEPIPLVQNKSTSSLPSKTDPSSLHLIQWPAFPKELSGPNLGIPPKKMSGPHFVAFLEWVFKQMSYETSRMKETHDMGGDILLKKFGEITVIQAIRRKQNIGVKAIQEVHAAKDYYNATHAIVITPSHFTPSALKLANKLGVECWDWERLLTELHKHHIYYE